MQKQKDHDETQALVRRLKPPPKEAGRFALDGSVVLGSDGLPPTIVMGPPILNEQHKRLILELKKFSLLSHKWSEMKLLSAEFRLRCFVLRDDIKITEENIQNACDLWMYFWPDPGLTREKQKEIIVDKLSDTLWEDRDTMEKVINILYEIREMARMRGIMKRLTEWSYISPENRKIWKKFSMVVSPRELEYQWDTEAKRFREQYAEDRRRVGWPELGEKILMRRAQPDWREQMLRRQQRAQQSREPLMVPMRPLDENEIIGRKRQLTGLPPHWRIDFDKSSNRQFYINTTTGHSQWDPPSVARKRQSTGEDIDIVRKRHGEDIEDIDSIRKRHQQHPPQPHHNRLKMIEESEVWRYIQPELK